MKNAASPTSTTGVVPFLPAGPTTLTVGSDYRVQTFRTSFSPSLSSANLIPTPATDRDRTVTAALKPAPAGVTVIWAFAMTMPESLLTVPVRTSDCCAGACACASAAAPEFNTAARRDAAVNARKAATALM